MPRRQLAWAFPVIDWHRELVMLPEFQVMLKLVLLKILLHRELATPPGLQVKLESVWQETAAQHATSNRRQMRLRPRSRNTQLPRDDGQARSMPRPSAC